MFISLRKIWGKAEITVGLAAVIGVVILLALFGSVRFDGDLDNEAIKMVMRTDAGPILTENLDWLRSLPSDAQTETAKIVYAAPADYRQEVIETLKALTAVATTDAARLAAIRVVGGTRSHEHFAALRAYAAGLSR